MGSGRVRVLESAAVPTAALRRKPRQSRARVTQEALQQAFVRVLMDVGFDAMTVREIAGVAGVGIGTFYEYSSSKHALAALTIHMRTKELGHHLVNVAQQHAGHALAEMLNVLIDHQLALVRADAAAWAALFVLERRISSPDAYRKNYAKYLQAWVNALKLAADAPVGAAMDSLARMVHTLVYGWVSQSLLCHGDRVDWTTLQHELALAVRGYWLGCQANADPGRAPQAIAPASQPLRMAPSSVAG